MIRPPRTPRNRPYPLALATSGLGTHALLLKAPFSPLFTCKLSLVLPKLTCLKIPVRNCKAQHSLHQNLELSGWSGEVIYRDSQNAFNFLTTESKFVHSNESERIDGE